MRQPPWEHKKHKGRGFSQEMNAEAARERAANTSSGEAARMKTGLNLPQYVIEILDAVQIGWGKGSEWL